MIKLKHIKLTNIVGTVSCLGLLSLAFFAITPPVYDGVNAEQTGTQLPVEVKAGLILSLALDQNSIYLGEVSPTTNGTFVEGSVKLTAETNAVDGYKLYINTADNSTAMTKVSEGVSTIPSISSAVDKANFPANQWGYSIATGNTASSTYEPIKAQDNATSPVTTTSAGSESYTLNFATKLDTTLPAGTYRNTMMVSAVTNPETIVTLDKITTMQEMTHQVCDNTLATNADDLPAGSRQIVTPGNEPSKQLIDTRDGKKYWVSKLADQNCWMTQNLDLDIPATGLKAVDTDIETDWNSSSEYPPMVTNTTNDYSLGGDSNTSTYSWNINKDYDYVIKQPLSSINCGEIASGKNLDGCSEQVQKIDGTWQPTLNTAQNGNVAVNTINKTYDAHYLVGNYYQFNTAVASSVGTSTSIIAEHSICPKGWTLPNNTTTYFYATLTTDYNLTSADIDAVLAAPFHMARSGGINSRSTHTLNNVGAASSNWTGVAQHSIAAGSIDGGILTAGRYSSNYRSSGYTVRCVAR